MSSSIPSPSPNGGLYTGEPFARGAPYGNVPIVPDAGYMIHTALATANPPPGADTQYAVGLRPGNNRSILTGLEYDSDHGLLLVSRCPALAAGRPCRFRKYAYVR